MVILFENERYLITLGPDCNPSTIQICASSLHFLPLLFCKLLLPLLCLVNLIIPFSEYCSLSEPSSNNSPIFWQPSPTQELPHKLISILKAKNKLHKQKSKQIIINNRFCKECNLPMLPKMHHCRFCGVCVKGYDHHCPWTSKCIGQNNLKRFYVFATITPLYLLLSVICLSI